MNITSKDEELLAILRENARISVSGLARRLGISRTAAQARLEKLERTGVIAGYMVKFSPAFEKARIKALVLIKSSPANRALVERSLAMLPNLTKLYSISGTFDLAAEVSAQFAEELDTKIDHIGKLEGVIDTMTSVILSTKIDR